MSQLQENQLFAEKYRLVKKLGSGSFGDVWLADYKGVQVAVKIYNQLDEQGLEDFLSEFKISYSLNHTNLLHITNYDVFGNNPYLVMPYCSNGSCKKFIGNIDEETAWRFIRDVSGGLSYLHKLNPPIIHQDIKPDNVLITETGDFVITDFGISKRIRSTLNKSVRNISAGTRAYMGPERYSKTPTPIKASDIWSLGATVYELMTGEVPFGEIGGGMQKGGADIPDIEGNYSNLLKQTVEACLAKDPWDRPTAEQLSKYADKVLNGETPKAPWQSEVQEHHSSSQDSGRPTQRIISSPPQENDFGRTTQYKAERQTIIVNGVSFEMVYVEGGTFTMGCTSEQGSSCDDDEKPAHQVLLSDFYIGKYEVTQELWQAVMGSNPSDCKGSNLPVERVSWNNVQEFIAKLNQKTGQQFRLPTEAQWEFAARGENNGNGYKYSGSNTLGNVGWYDVNSGRKTHPVGQKTSNELGLYDMSGNVWEWCQDWIGSYSSGSQTNPTGPSTGSYRVLRGGSWSDDERSCRVSNRYYSASDYRSQRIGFRVVLFP